MNNWDEHTVHFAPSEGLQKNETEVRVLDNGLDENEKKAAVSERVDKLREDTTVEQLHEREVLTAKVREDPGYKFLMQVSAFSTLRFSKMASTTNAPPDGDIDDQVVDKSDGVDFKWMQAPEISGVVFLTPSVYGHIKEAQTIAHNSFIRAPLKDLVENPEYATLFARLVALRMSLSAALNGIGGQLDGTYRRLLQQQTMVLRALRSVRKYATYDLTRPAAALRQFLIQ